MPDDVTVEPEDLQWATRHIREIVRARVELAQEDLASSLVLTNLQGALAEASAPAHLYALLAIFTKLTYGLADFLARCEGRANGIEPGHAEELLEILLSDDTNW